MPNIPEDFERSKLFSTISRIHKLGKSLPDSFDFSLLPSVIKTDRNTKAARVIIDVR